MNRCFMMFLFGFISFNITANPLTSSSGYLDGKNTFMDFELENEILLSRSKSELELQEYEESLQALVVLLADSNIKSQEKALNILDLKIWSTIEDGMTGEELEQAINNNNVGLIYETAVHNLERVKSEFEELEKIEIEKAKERAKAAEEDSLCFQNGSFWCRQVFKYTPNFGGVGLGLNEESNSLKVNVWRMSLGLSDHWRIPFNIYIADVDSTIDSEQANTTKLLDLEQGRLNLMFSGIGKFRIWEFCNFTERGGKGCYAGFQVGARYSEFEAFDENTGETQKKGAAGAYAKLGINTLFPLYEENTVGEAGTLAVGVGAVFYYQNVGDSSILFPSVTDSQGDPVKFNKDYSAMHLSMELNLTKQFVIRAAHYEPFSNDQLSSTTAFEFTYSPDNKKN